MLKSPGKDQEKLNLKIDRQIKKKRKTEREPVIKIYISWREN